MAPFPVTSSIERVRFGRAQIAVACLPFAAAYLPAAPTYITSLDYQPVSLDALVRALFGEIGPQGKLPVTVRLPPPRKGVLYWLGFAQG